MTDSFQNVLPPRPAGVASLLNSHPELDVVFLEHHGFENGVKFKDFWRGSFVNNKISIRDGSFYGILYGVLVHCNTNLTCQLIYVQNQMCKCRESSNLARNRTCQNSSKWQYS